MIVKHYDMPFSEKLELVTQVLSGFGYKWFIIIAFVIVASWFAHKQETAGKDYRRHKRTHK